MIGIRVSGLGKNTIARLNFLAVGLILLGFAMAWISTTWVHPVNPRLATALAVLNAVLIGLGIVLRTIRGAEENSVQ